MAPPAHVWDCLDLLEDLGVKDCQDHLDSQAMESEVHRERRAKREIVGGRERPDLIDRGLVWLPSPGWRAALNMQK